MTCSLQKAPVKPKKTKEPKEDKPKNEEKKEEVPAENGEAKADDEVNLLGWCIEAHINFGICLKKNPNTFAFPQAPASEETEKKDDAAE